MYKMVVLLMPLFPSVHSKANMTNLLITHNAYCLISKMSIPLSDVPSL